VALESLQPKVVEGCQFSANDSPIEACEGEYVHDDDTGDNWFDDHETKNHDHDHETKNHDHETKNHETKNHDHDEWRRVVVAPTAGQRALAVGN
jgi:hypothetical protein